VKQVGPFHGSPGTPGLSGGPGGPGGQGGAGTWIFEDLAGQAYVNLGSIYLGGHWGTAGARGDSGSTGGNGGRGGYTNVHWPTRGEEPHPDVNPDTTGGDFGAPLQDGEDGTEAGGGGGGGGASLFQPGGSGGRGGDGWRGDDAVGGSAAPGSPDTLVTDTPDTNTVVVHVGGIGGEGGDGGDGGTGGGGGGGAGDWLFQWGLPGPGGAAGQGGLGGAGGAPGIGSIVIRSGSHLVNEHELVIDPTSSASGSMLVEAGGIFTNRSSTLLHHYLTVAPGGLVVNDGAGVLEIWLGVLNLLGEGSALENHGDMSWIGTALLIGPGAHLLNTGWMDGYPLTLPTGATFENNGEAHLSVNNYGLLSGCGSLAWAVENHGSLHPDGLTGPIGSFALLEDAVLRPGRLQIEIGHSAVGPPANDSLLVHGEAILSPGILEVAFVDGFSELDLGVGDSFDFLFYGWRTGEFAVIEDDLTSGHWELSYDHEIALHRLCARLTYESDAVAVSPAESLPRRFALHPVRPNPFRSRVTLSYDLPRAAHVELRVYDVTGRLVRTLRDGAVEAPGAYSVTWSGRTDRGGMASSGIYWSRLVAGNFVQTRTLTLLK